MINFFKNKIKYKNSETILFVLISSIFVIQLKNDLLAENLLQAVIFIIMGKE